VACLTQVWTLSEKMELVTALWAHIRYLFLWDGSPEPDSIGAWRRLPQSVFKVEESTFSAKLPFFRRICATDGEIFWAVFFRIWDEDLERYGKMAELHQRGLVQMEGEEYEMEDWDVVWFLFKG